jgi:putative redox protein
MAEIDIWYEKDLSTRAVHSENKAELLTDAPKEAGGPGRVFSPTDLFAASLGSCILTLMGLAAKRLNIAIQGTHAKVIKEMATAPTRSIGKLSVLISCPNDFPEEVKAKLIRAAETCPVHQSLHPDIILNIAFRWGTAV